jgi:undecaprenyl-diphosphatase
MQSAFMKRPFLTARAGRLALWLSGAALALLVFVRITMELREGDVNALDHTILQSVEKLRTPALTSAAIDVTALGSTTLVFLFTALALLMLLAFRDRLGALQLLAASAGASVLTLVTKDIIERVRPEEAQRLIVVSGYSYPSGHSVSTAALYLTIAILIARHVQNARARAAIFVALSAVPLVVAASRVYLGVHFPTDVVSGISLGAAWALVLTGLFTLLGQRERPQP